MQTRVDEIAPDTFRISTFHPGFGIQFNQFLVRDDKPFLMHTGMRGIFDATRDAVRQLIDPARLAWIQATIQRSESTVDEQAATIPRSEPTASGDFHEDRPKNARR